MCIQNNCISTFTSIFNSNFPKSSRYTPSFSPCRTWCEVRGLSKVFQRWSDHLLHQDLDGRGSQWLEVWDSCKSTLTICHLYIHKYANFIRATGTSLTLRHYFSTLAKLECVESSRWLYSVNLSWYFWLKSLRKNNSNATSDFCFFPEFIKQCWKLFIILITHTHCQPNMFIPKGVYLFHIETGIRDFSDPPFCPAIFFPPAKLCHPSARQRCIINNTHRLVELCVAKLSQDWFPLLELLAMATNPHCKFHIYNGTRPSETVPAGAQTTDDELFARPPDPRSPKVNVSLPKLSRQNSLLLLGFFFGFIYRLRFFKAPWNEPFCICPTFWEQTVSLSRVGEILIHCCSKNVLGVDEKRCFFKFQCLSIFLQQRFTKSHTEPVNAFRWWAKVNFHKTGFILKPVHVL